MLLQHWTWRSWQRSLWGRTGGLPYKLPAWGARISAFLQVRILPDMASGSCGMYASAYDCIPSAIGRFQSMHVPYSEAVDLGLGIRKDITNLLCLTACLR